MLRVNAKVPRAQGRRWRRTVAYKCASKRVNVNFLHNPPFLFIGVTCEYTVRKEKLQNEVEKISRPKLFN